jgi:hypothetical protein
MNHKPTRRQFIGQTAALRAAFWVVGNRALSAAKSPNEKLNIGVIGCGGRGFRNLEGCRSENIVTLCDVDEQRGAEAFKQFPAVKRYHDYRVMLDKQRDLDAVIVSTPDHHHAPASVMAMKLGKHDSVGWKRDHGRVGVRGHPFL